jgi:hypothetical protein
MHIKKQSYALPRDFKFPQAYLDLIANGLPDIDPWWWLALYKDSEIFWTDTLREQFPSRRLVPFAKHGSFDDVACFDGFDTSNDPKILYIHAFCSPGWEHRGEASNFIEWLRKVKIEAAEFKAQDSEDKKDNRK